MTTPDNIAANAEYHTQLLTSIAELDYAPAALSSQSSYISDLEGRLSESEEKLKILAEKTKKERKEHATLRDSTTRRLAHKLTGRKEKYEAKESKEEREYVEALEHELTETDNQQEIKQMLSEARHVRDELKAKASRHESLKSELANLYSVVFDGPSESFPEDDKLEYDLDAAHRRHEEIQQLLNQESQAAQILTKAVNMMSGCQNKMQEALGYSRWDMWGGGGMSDMMERNALRTAQALAYQAENIVDQACRISPQVQPVGRVNIAQGSIMSDVFFDNVFTDMSFHNKIKTSAAQVLLALNRLKAERDAANLRAEDAGNKLVQASRTLHDCRAELDAYRSATFESVVTALHPEPFKGPPSYDQILEQPAKPSPAKPGPSTAAPDSTSKPSSRKITSSPRSNSPEPSGSKPSSSSNTPGPWGTRNPYAAALAERTRSMTLELK